MLPDPYVPHEKELKTILEQVIAETHVPGIGIVASVNGRQASAFVGVAAFGQRYELSDQSRFEMSCLMKLFLSLVAVELASKGTLDVNRPLEEYLPELRLECFHGEKPCVRHLLSHTSGYRGLDVSNSRIRWNFTWERFIEHYAACGQSFLPGSVFNYEHSEHVILGRIIENICGEPATEVVKNRIFRPLGISPSCAKLDSSQQRAFVAQHTYSAKVGCYMPIAIPAFGPFWASSLPDATITLHEVIAVGENLLAIQNTVGGPAVFDPATLATLRRPGLTLPYQVSSGVRAEEAPIAFGPVCAHYRDGVIGHNASMFGQTCSLRMDLSQNVAVAVGVNAWSPYARDNVLNRALALISRCTDFGDEVARSNGPSFPLEHLTGGFPPDVLAGSYMGSYFGEVHVSCTTTHLHFDLGQPGTARSRISAFPDQFPLYKIESPVPIMLGFFNDPTDRDSPALMVGVHAYKKQPV